MEDLSNRTPNRARAMCWWIAGVCREDMAGMPARTKMATTTVGMILIANVAFLVAAWSVVGWRYFGAAGLLVPGLLVPLIFVVGLDRLIAMERRRLKGDLASFEPAGPRRHSPEVWFRVTFASLFASVTTFSLMLDLSASSIRDRQIKVAAIANEPLRREYVELLSSASTLVVQQNAARIQQIDEELRLLRSRIQRASAPLADTESAARKAAEEMVREEKGVGRLKGQGDRYMAQQEIHAVNEAALRAMNRDTDRLQDRVDRLEAEAFALRAAAAKASTELQSKLDTVDQRIRADQRYVPAQGGLFSDASTFIALYADKDEGTGRWWISVLLAEFLFALECSALLALRLNPVSLLDLVKHLDTTQRASRLVADAAVGSAKLSSRSTTPRKSARGGRVPAAP